MKNKLVFALLLFLVLICPTMASSNYTITLNGLSYEPAYSPQVQKNTLLLALDDLVALTYSDYTSSENGTYTLSVQDNTLSFSLDNKSAKLNGQPIVLAHPALKVTGVIYVPITFLDLVKYPYTLSDDQLQLSIISKLPYSSTTDSFKSHYLSPTEAKFLESVFDPFMPKGESSNTLVAEALKNNQYLSFVSSTNKSQLFAKFKELINAMPEVEVAFRQVDLLAATPSIKQLSTFPLELKVVDDHLNLSYNKQTTHYNCLWTTYNPSTHTTSIDINKSLDVTIMRALYEYFRDTNDLKDDVHFSPITTVQMGRSDAINYTVYSDHLLDTTSTYKVVIYKKISPQKITYMVDLISKS